MFCVQNNFDAVCSPTLPTLGRKDVHEFGVGFKVGICERVRKEEKLT
jgi:hypothetical protein